MNAPALIEPTLDALAAEINAAHVEAQAFSSQAVERAHDAGIRLNQAKAQCQHGDWLPWLAEHCPAVSERTARAYMQLARDWKALETKTAVTADLTLDAALKLLSAPKAAKKPAQKRLPATPAKTATPADLPKSEPVKPAVSVSKPGAFEAALLSIGKPDLPSPLAVFDAVMNAPSKPEPRLDLGFLDMPNMQQLDERFNDLLNRAFPEPEHVGFQRVIRPIEELRDFMPKFIATEKQAQATVDLLENLTQQARLRLAWLESHPEPQPNQEATP